jgi:hypothetical protein
VFDLLEYFLGHNEGVDREFLERILPANVRRDGDPVRRPRGERTGARKPGEAAPAQ